MPITYEKNQIDWVVYLRHFFRFPLMILQLLFHKVIAETKQSLYFLFVSLLHLPNKDGLETLA